MDEADDLLQSANTYANLAFFGLLIPLLGWIFGAISLSKLSKLDYSNYERSIHTKAWVAIILSTLVAIFVGFETYIHTNYSFVYDDNFMNSCEAQGADAAACSCALSYVKENYTFSQARVFDETEQIPASLSYNINDQCSDL